MDLYLAPTRLWGTPKSRACPALRNLNVPGSADAVAECAAMSAAQRLAAIVIALLVLIGIAVVALNLTDGGVAADPSATPSVSPAGAGHDDAPTDAPSPADEDDVLATLAEIEEQVSPSAACPPPISARPSSSPATSCRRALALFEGTIRPRSRPRTTRRCARSGCWRRARTSPSSSSSCSATRSSASTTTTRSGWSS